MTRYRVEERDPDGNRLAVYESVSEAAEVLGLNKGTITYSICHEGHIVKKTGSAFYKLDETVTHCAECKWRELYNLNGRSLIGCGYNLRTGKMRGCKIEDCERWREK